MVHAQESSVLFSLRELMTLEERRVAEEDAARLQREQRAAEEARRLQAEGEARRVRADEEAWMRARADEARARADAARAEEAARGSAMREVEAAFEAKLERSALQVREEHEQAVARLHRAAKKKQRVLSAAAATFLAVTGALLVSGWLRLRSESVVAAAAEERAAAEARQRAVDVRRLAEDLEGARLELARLHAQLETTPSAPAPSAAAATPVPHPPMPVATPHPKPPTVRPCAHEGDPLCTALP